ncbi:MAG: hypothetical protein HY855_05405 [Burkholderiales bacterium]|nr:hypothetical protein [Burkholderiales bacterium]
MRTFITSAGQALGRLVAMVACLGIGASGAAASELTPTEQRWLTGLWPVVLFAWQAQLPLDIVVQPQPTPGAAPLALGFVAGRCKLVLSMRGNAQAQQTLDDIEPELLDATLELMAAHELGHCRRYLEGAWFVLPAGFAAQVPPALDAHSRAEYLAMQAAQREEAYGDLVGLAWTWQRHPALYGRLQRWLVAERSRDLIPGSHHDTLHWVQRATHGQVLAGASIFSAAAAVWAGAPPAPGGR